MMDLTQTVTATAAGVTVDARLTYFGPDGIYGTGDDVTYTASAPTSSQSEVSFKLSRAPQGKYRVDVTGGAGHTPALDQENPSCYDTNSHSEFACP